MCIRDRDCSTLKGAHASGASLQAAGGLHYLKSNYEQILCDTIWKECSIPLLSHLDAYRQSVQERQQSHEVTMEEHKRVLKSIEAQYHKSGSRHTRDLQSFRTMLTELQDKVNEMEDTKAQHYMDVLQNEEHTWDLVAQNVLLLVRAQVDICLLYTSPSPRDGLLSRMPSSA